MSQLTSELLPEDINELPPARQRHIRRQPRTASVAERQILLQSLLDLTSPNLNFFLLSMLGGISIGIALHFDDPALLIVAIVALPFLMPIYGLALLPASRKKDHALKSLVSLLIILLLIFGSGVLAGWLRKDFPLENINLYRFSAPYWLDLALVSGASILSVFILLRKGQLPRLIGLLLAYEILLPLAAAGLCLPLGAADILPGALFVSLSHLGLAWFLAMATFFLLGFTPSRWTGWLFSILPLIFAIVGLLFNLPIFQTFSYSTPLRPTTTSSPTPLPILSPSPTIMPSATNTKEALQPTLSLTYTTTPSKTITQTPAPSQTPAPTTYLAIVNAQSGAVIRESPTFDAPVAGYLNDGDQVIILGLTTNQEGTLWYRVKIPTGQEGWLLGSLVNTQTPTPAEE